MMTMDDSVYKLFEQGRIDQDTAVANVMDSATVRKITAFASGGATGQEDSTAASSSKKAKKGWKI